MRDSLPAVPDSMLRRCLRNPNHWSISGACIRSTDLRDDEYSQLHTEPPSLQYDDGLRDEGTVLTCPRGNDFRAIQSGFWRTSAFIICANDTSCWSTSSLTLLSVSKAQSWLYPVQSQQHLTGLD